MTTSPITLHPFEPSDFRALAEIYRPAFFQTRLTNFILGGVSPQACDEWMVKRLGLVYAYKHAKGETGGIPAQVEIVVAKREGECVGFAWWDFFPPIEERKPGVEERFWPEGRTVSREIIEYMELVDGADDLCETPHWRELKVSLFLRFFYLAYSCFLVRIQI